MQIGSEDKAAALPKHKRNLELFGHKGRTARQRGHPGQEACKRGLVSTSHYVGAVSESRDSVEPIIQSWDWDYGGVRLF